MSLDSHDIGIYFRYNNDNSDNNKYLQELGIHNNVNGDNDILQKKVLTFAISYLIRIGLYFFASCRGVYLQTFSTKLHLIKRKKKELSCFG